MRPPLPLLATLALAGCDALQPDASAELTTARTVYAPGETVEVQIENRGLRPLYYGGCWLTVELQEGGRWVDVDAAPNRVCTEELRVLGRGQALTVRRALREDLSAGEYRVAFYFGPDDRSPIEEEVTATPIRVER